MTRLTLACAVDMSDCSRRALHYAGALADHFGARLVVVHVNQPGAHPGEAAEERLRDFVLRSVPAGTRGGHGLEITVRQGHPGREILGFVRAGNADLLVMGTRGEAGIQTAFLGSTTEHALRRSPIPVLAVPPHERDSAAPLLRSGPVVVPIDFRAASVSAARIGRGIALALSVPLVLVHVLPPSAAPATFRQVLPEEPGTAAGAHGLLGALASSLGPDVALDVIVRQGSRRAEITDVALERSASVIVMSLKGQAAPVGPRGSRVVVYGVMCHAPVPVLAVPRAAFHAFPHDSAPGQPRAAEVPV